MADHSRRASSAASIVSPPPPPPLPLRYNNAFTKFITQPFNYAARPPAQHDGARPPSSLPRIVGPLSSQNATHRTGLEIGALDLSPDRTRAVLAGRDILKTILVHGTNCAEEFNLLAAMRQYASHNSARPRPKDALDIHDVKWSHSAFDTLIATAASSGRVVLYDINRSEVELARLHEHPRQVHKLAFNPHHGALLLSGSQDGTTKLWDMRDLKRHVGTCPSQYTHNGQSDGVRDVKWSPTDGVEFAFGTDSGIIQRWDYRQPKAPKLKVNAHNRACHAIDWHLDGLHLVSAGLDKTVSVWNFASDARRQKPAWTLQAPYPVLHVRWRPPCRSSEAQGDRTWQSTHLVTSYDRDHSAVHVWDFRRPNIPFRELLHYNAAPTDLLWHSQDLLWTVGREGVFNQTDIKFAPKLTERRNLQAFAVASHGELTCVSGEAPQGKNPRLGRSVSESVPNSSTPKGLSPEKASFGRTSIDDSIDEGFLSSSFKKRHARSGSNRSSKSLSNTPPSYDDVVKIKSLDETLPRKETSSPSQIAGRSLTAAGISNPLLFTLLAHTYISSLPEEGNNARPDLLSIAKVLEGNSIYAKRAGYHRIAQSFKILHRSLIQPPASLAADWQQLRDIGHPSQKSSSPSRIISTGRTENCVSDLDHAASVSREKTATTANSSSAATPLARPRYGGIPADSTTEPHLEDPGNATHLVLPPSLIEPSLLTGERAPRSNSRMLDRPPSRLGDDDPGTVEDFDKKRESTGNRQPRPKTLLDLSPPPQGGGMYIQPTPLDRQDSNESFPMFSASTDSYRNSIRSSSSSALSREPDRAGLRGDPNTMAAPGIQSHNSSNGDVQVSGPMPLAGAESFPTVSNMSEVTDTGMQVSNNSSHLGESDRDGHQQLSSVASARNVHHDPRQQPTRPSAILPSNDKLQRRQSVTFGPDPGIKNTNSGNDSLTPAPSSKLSPESKGHPSADRLSNPDGLASQIVASSESMPKPLAPRFWDSIGPTAGLLLPRLVSYHTNQSPDAQFAAHVLLLLSPFLLEECSSLTSWHEGPSRNYDTSLETSAEQAQAMTKVYQEKLIQLGISPLHTESIMATYHDQLVSLRLFNTAAQFRRLCFPLYPGVYDQFSGRAQVGFLCQICKSPINSLSRDNRCKTCKSRQSSCPICWSDYSPFEHCFSTSKDRSRRRGRSRNTSLASDRRHPASTVLPPSLPAAPLAKSFAAHFTMKSSISPARPTHLEHASSTNLKSRPFNDGAAHSRLYTSCTLCNHSSHASCHRAWLTGMSDGGCPTPGCMCDCARGTWRDANGELREQRLGGSRVRAVRGDKWGVKESKAVAMVRGTLGVGGSGRGEEGKRVRVVDPGAD